MTVEDLRNVMWNCHFEVEVVSEEGDDVIYHQWKGELTEELMKKEVDFVFPRVDIINGQKDIVITVTVK